MMGGLLPLPLSTPLADKIEQLENRVRKLELRTLLLAVIGLQTTVVLVLLMVIISMLNHAPG